MECKHLCVLTAVFLIYLCLGAVTFQATESGAERVSIAAMVRDYRAFIGNHSCVSGDDLVTFIEEVLDKVGPYGGLTRARFDTNVTKSLSRVVWDFPGAFTFCVTVITTIGYGHMFPVSPLGRLLCVVYALLGIPLTLFVLSGIGDQLNGIGRRIMSLKLCFQSPTINKALNMAGVVLTGIVVMFIIPTIVFNIVEGWDILKGVYYCFITLSTIGFGDYVAGNGDGIENETYRNIYRIVVYLWILVGLAYISLIIKSLSDLFVKKAEQVTKEAKKRVATTRLAGTLSTVSALAGLVDDMALDSTSGQTGSGCMSGGPTMTYKKHGFKRFLLAGDGMHQRAEVQLVGISILDPEGRRDAGDKQWKGEIQENNNVDDKDETNGGYVGSDAETAASSGVVNT